MQDKQDLDQLELPQLAHMLEQARKEHARAREEVFAAQRRQRDAVEVLNDLHVAFTKKAKQISDGVQAVLPPPPVPKPTFEVVTGPAVPVPLSEQDLGKVGGGVGIVSF